MANAIPEEVRPEPQPGEDDYGLNPELVRAIREALDGGDLAGVREIVAALHAADVADLLEQVDPDQRRRIVSAIGAELDPHVLPELDPNIRDEVVALLEPEDLASAVQELETDDALEVVADLDEAQRRELLARLPDADRLVIERGLTYPEYTAGRLMQRDLVAVPAFWTVGETIDFMRGSPNLPDDFYDLFVVDPRHRPIGTIPLSRVLRNRRPVMIGDIMDSDVTPIPVSMDQEALAFMFRQQDLVSAPVVDDSGRLAGVITIDDVVDVIDEEAEDDIMKLGGVQEDDLYRAALDTARSRFGWLFVNLWTAVLASAVIALFEATIDQIVALAVLMPIVASMGGNAGTQSLTVAVRALTTRELSPANAFRIILKELIVGGINGVLFAIIAGLVAGFWFSPTIGAVIGAAMVVNLIVAGFFGVAIPVGLSRAGIDPAVASPVLLTTVTDVVGFFAFLGLAGLLLL